MPRLKLIDKTVEKRLCLPQRLVVQVELELFSEVEGKLPYGAWQKYLVNLIEKDLAQRKAARESAKQTNQEANHV